MKKSILSLILSLLLMVNGALTASAESVIWDIRRVPDPLHSLPAFKSLPDVTSKGPQNLALPKQLTPAMNTLLTAIPLNKAKLIEVHKSEDNKKPLIVLIQDIHQNEEAQLNIASVFESLSRHYTTISTDDFIIGVEAAFETFDFSSFHALPNSKITNDVAHTFLKIGRLSAPSLTGIINTDLNASFVGIDDKNHYFKNIAAYKKAHLQKETARKKFKAAEQQLRKKKEKTLNPRLKKFDELRRAFEKDRLPLGRYLKELVTLDGPSHLDPNITLFMTASELEENLNLTTVERERNRVLSQLVRKLKKEEVDQLIQAGLHYKMGKTRFADYYRLIQKRLALHNISLDRTPAFRDYVRYVLLADKINVSHLLDELNEFEWRLSDRLARSDEEAHLIKESRHAYHFEKILTFSLTPDEWENYQDYSSSFFPFDVDPFENFYREADIRSRYLVDNLLTQLPEGTPGAAMIIGGFHTDLVKARLKEKGASYAVVQPHITRIEKETGTEYLSVFTREQTELDRIFSGRKLFLGLYQTTVGTSQAAPNARMLRSTSRILAAHRGEPVAQLKRVKSSPETWQDDKESTQARVTDTPQNPNTAIPVPGYPALEFEPSPNNPVALLSMSGFVVLYLTGALLPQTASLVLFVGLGLFLAVWVTLLLPTFGLYRFIQPLKKTSNPEETIKNRLESWKPHISKPPPKNLKLSVVVPIYREYENGNIFRLLESFSNQEGTDFTDFELLFVVNNTPEATQEKSEGYRDNQKMLALLRYLSNPQSEPMPRGLTDWQKVVLRRTVAKKIATHFIDKSIEGMPKLIGEIRNIGNLEAAYRMNKRGINGLIANLDGDAVVSSNYVKRLTELSSDPRVDAVFPDLDNVFMGGTKEDFSNHFRYRLGTRSRNFYLWVHEPYFPDLIGPQLVARKSTFIDVNGFDDNDELSKRAGEAPRGEDTRFSLKLKKYKARFIRAPEIRIEPADRSRPDSYLGGMRKKLISQFDRYFRHKQARKDESQHVYLSGFHVAAIANEYEKRIERETGAVDARNIFADITRKYGIKIDKQWLATGKLENGETITVEDYINRIIKHQSFIEDIDDFRKLHLTRFPESLARLKKQLTRASKKDKRQLNQTRHTLLDILKTVFTLQERKDPTTHIRRLLQRKASDITLKSLADEDWFIELLFQLKRSQPNPAGALEALTQEFPDWLRPLSDKGVRHDIVLLETLQNFIHQERHKTSEFQSYLQSFVDAELVRLDQPIREEERNRFIKESKDVLFPSWRSSLSYWLSVAFLESIIFQALLYSVAGINIWLLAGLFSSAHMIVDLANASDSNTQGITPPERMALLLYHLAFRYGLALLLTLPFLYFSFPLAFLITNLIHLPYDFIVLKILPESLRLFFPPAAIGAVHVVNSSERKKRTAGDKAALNRLVHSAPIIQKLGLVNGIRARALDQAIRSDARMETALLIDAEEAVLLRSTFEGASFSVHVPEAGESPREVALRTLRQDPDDFHFVLADGGKITDRLIEDFAGRPVAFIAEGTQFDVDLLARIAGVTPSDIKAYVSKEAIASLSNVTLRALRTLDDSPVGRIYVILENLLAEPIAVHMSASKLSTKPTLYRLLASQA